MSLITVGFCSQREFDVRVAAASHHEDVRHDHAPAVPATPSAARRAVRRVSGGRGPVLLEEELQAARSAGRAAPRLRPGSTYAK